MPRLIVSLAALAVLLQAIPAAHARPYRVITARTPRSTGSGNLEFGLRYQGLFAGDGRAQAPGQPVIDPQSFQQVAGSLRWGIISQLELGLEASAIVFHQPGTDELEVTAGDVVASLQGRLLQTRHHLLGLLVGFTIPTGPSDVDILPPFWADGTFDVEALLLYEFVLNRSLRLILDAGYVHSGTRDPAGAVPAFDVPDAFRWDLAAAAHLGPRVLAALELNGRHYLREDVTPFWVDNQQLLELAPGLRVEIVPRLVLELGLGFGLTRAAREMFLVRGQAGLTYEFSVY